MGLLEQLQSLLGANSTEAKDGGDEYGPFNLPPRERVNLNRRTDIIATHYDAVTREQAESLAGILKEEMDSSQFSPREVRKRFESEVGLDREVAERMMRIEIGSVQTEDSIRRYTSGDIEVHVEWMLPGDGDVHPVCKATADEIENQGGAVSIEELHSIFREKASEFEDEGGTPERVDHWVVHEGNCRCAISPVVV